MKNIIRALVAVAAGFVLSVGLGAGSASATPFPVGFFLLPGGSNGGLPVNPPSGTTSYQLWLDPSNAPGGPPIFGTSATIIANGALTINSFVAVESHTLGSISGNTLSIGNTGDQSAGNSVAFEVGTLNIVNAGGIGDVSAWSGDFTESDGSTVGHLVVPQILAQVVPEPGTLVMLGAGLGGLAVLIRRSRNQS